MDHVYTLLMLIVPSSVLCGHVPAPVELKIKSHHMVHLLTWEAGPDSPSGLHYRVIFRSYTPGWKMVDACADVFFPLRCNLTDVLSNPEETYYINVTAVLGNETSTPSSSPAFIPVSDTELELPSLRVSPCNETYTLCVDLHSPSERLDILYKKFNYQLNVTNERGDQFMKNTKGLATVEFKVVPGLVYCVSVNIDHRNSSAEPVCGSTPAENNAGIWGLLWLVLVLAAMIYGLLVCRRQMSSEKRLPSVLSSFNAPYKEQILPCPSEESLNQVSLEPNICEDVPIDKEADQEKVDATVAYEGRRGCGEIAEESSRFYPCSADFHVPDPAAETHTAVPRTFLKELPVAEDLITLLCEEKDPQKSSGILAAHISPPPVHDLDNLLRNKKEDELGVEEKDMEGMDNVNFFSLTLGGHNLEQHLESENEEDYENGNNAKPEVGLCTLGLPEPATNLQPTYSEHTDTHFSDEDDEDEAFSGYMMRC